MANINFPTDGQGTQSLKKVNSKSKLINDIDAAKPDSRSQKEQQQPAPQKDNAHDKHQEPHQEPHTTASENRQHTPESENSRSHLEEPPVPTQTLFKRRAKPLIERGPDRRQQNRRQHEISVLLNTRSEHERRTNAGRRKEDYQKNNASDTNGGDNPQSFGIDTEA